MANQSIYNAFKRMWQHVVAALGNKIDSSGGNMTGVLGTQGINLTSGADYGEAMPADASNGRLFFVPDDTTDKIIWSGYDKDSGWYGQKFESGIVHCWKSVQKNIAAGDFVCSQTMIGSYGFYQTSNITIQYSYPKNLFIERPVEMVTMSMRNEDNTKGTFAPYSLLVADTGDKIQTNAYRISGYKKPDSGFIAVLDFHVYGFWKALG